MNRRELKIVHTRYARCPIASPNAKYSHNASTVIAAVATATTHVGVNSTIPTTTGINTSAVATRFQVIQTVLIPTIPRPNQNVAGLPSELYRHSTPSVGCAPNPLHVGCGFYLL